MRSGFPEKKNEGTFPFQALEAMYQETGVNPGRIKAVAFPDRLPLWQLGKVFKYGLQAWTQSGVFIGNYFKESIKRTFQLKRALPADLKHADPVYIEHHLCHAASAYFTCPWEQATIITVDGMGDFSMSGVTATGRSGNIELLKRLNGFYFARALLYDHYRNIRVYQWKT